MGNCIRGERRNERDDNPGRADESEHEYGDFDQVVMALSGAGLESLNLIVGICFTKSNEWTGRNCFNGRSLHEIGDISNPYEQVVSLTLRTLAPFVEGNPIHCFGFGDESTRDHTVLSFYEDHRPCHGIEEVLSRYREIALDLSLSGPTSFAPIIDVAMKVVGNNGGQYHVLVIVADGRPERASSQEQQTIDSIAAASEYPLSIVLVGVGDGSWEQMQQFVDNIPQRAFDNFQFVNFRELMSRPLMQYQNEVKFASAAFMKIPYQYKETTKLLGQPVGGSINIVPLPPPLSEIFHERQVCPICLTNAKDLALGCGHVICRSCSLTLENCPICCALIASRLRLYGN